MKKSLIVVGVALFLCANVASAQTVDQAQYQQLLRQVIQLLIQQVAQLQEQLVALQAQVAPDTSSTPPVQIELPPPPAISTGAAPDQTIAPTSTPAEATSTTTITPAVSFQRLAPNLFSVQNNGTSTIRIKHLDLGDADLDKFVFGRMYYPVRYTGYTILSCDGLGSLGLGAYGNPSFDICKRPDAEQAKNDIAPGQTLTFTTTGEVKSITYEPGSIVQVGTGQDVQFTGL